MVYIPRSVTDKLKAYLTADLSPNELDSIHLAFELGACSKFNPMVELFIADVPEYHTMCHEDIRRAEDAAGRTEAFLIIDSATPADGAVWYIDRFAGSDQVEDGEAESTDLLWKIRAKTTSVPLMFVNYSITNTSIEEDLRNSDDVPQNTASQPGSPSRLPPWTPGRHRGRAGEARRRWCG